jgi:hypothetical protein
MQRLLLALLFAFAAFAAVSVAVRMARAAWVAVDDANTGGRSGGDAMQKLAFFLLIGLILYVSVLGGA